MFDLDKWKEIWATLRSNRLRTFLTAFGVFWGILMLIAMLGFGSAMQSGTQRQMKGMATNLLFVWGQQTTEAFDGLPPGRQVRFETDDIEAEVARLEKLGAKRIAKVHTWVVMQAPTGQRFCVVRPQRPGIEQKENQRGE